jgi:diguanylate cyclase (GGDEF)-like protein/PAS domain S-box-containing protein
MSSPVDRESGFFKDLIDNLYDGVYLVDLDRRITYWNQAAERLTGYTADEVLGKLCSGNLLAHVDQEGRPLCSSELCPAAAAMREGAARDERVFLRHREGHRVAVRTKVAPIRGPEGRIVGALEVFSDDSAAVAAAQEIARLEDAALLDTVTGVGNRRFAELELDARIGALDRHGWALGVAFVDIDHFKAVNDTHGHAVGDAVLRLVAQTLKHALRSADTVARWGGEELVLLLADPGTGGLGGLCERLGRLVASAQVMHEGEPVKVTVSIGATLARAGERAGDVVARADRLMYASKDTGRNRVTVDTAG